MPAVIHTSSPVVFGHRGAAGNAPENTLAGLRQAKAEGAAWVEFDATISGDRPPRTVIFHDDTLERTTNGTGPVDRTPLNALRRLDAGEGEKIPTLEEAIETVTALDLKANVEIKVAPGRDRETAEAVMETLLRVWPSNREPPFISSFSVEALEIAQRMAPDWPRGYLMHEIPENWRETAERLGASSLNVNQAILDDRAIAAFKETGLPLFSYTVNEASRASDLVRQGVDGVFSDTPGRIIKHLAAEAEPKPIALKAPAPQATTGTPGLFSPGPALPRR